ncbi:uncharacterized protein BP5553_03126 [Venustampulla echinocandica]|uniref:Uncharacterized protein n=1 Tax=Venustampulla echinocandica TaxID=2656787 RepID=A0A370TTC6_9HELO|nr:uncharacterized protein BP5553_03126 [Venustampulla echinocandica]RDL38786.1 hypothetical protein BP5553_03126 [Venustampulla echinocandica]
MVSAVSLIAEFGWMLFLQSRLLKARYYSPEKPRKHPRSSVDILLVVIVFWALFIIVDHIFRLTFDLVYVVILKHGHDPLEETVVEPRHRSGAYDHGSLLRQVLATWIIHYVLNFWLETIVPLWKDILEDPDSVRDRFRVRTQELFELFIVITGINWMPELTSGAALNSMDEACGACHLVALEREKLADPTIGERILNWNITIDRGALDEIKEILGPPGGFGEMGFSVSNGGVCIGATAIGASFSLTFELKGAVEDQQSEKMSEEKE